jgi:hypothetical protein
MKRNGKFRRIRMIEADALSVNGGIAPQKASWLNF